LISESGLSAQLMLSLVSLLLFVGVFVVGVLVAYLWGKRVEKGKMDWQRYQYLRKQFSYFVAVGVPFTAFWVYFLVIGFAVIGLNLLFLMFSFVFGLPLFAFGLGIQTGSRVFPAKKSSN